jgi:hypothetical protein
MKGSRISSKMISSSSDAMAILNVENTVFPDMPIGDEITFNFSEPNTSLVPYLNLINDSEVSEIKIFDEKVTLIQGKQKSNIFFCSPHIVSVFEADSPRSDIEYFATVDVDDFFNESLSKIKKVGAKFGKIYFGVDNNVLYIETSDKQNRFSNGLRIDLMDVESENMSICLDFKNIVNAISIIGGDDFKLNISYVASQDLGMLYIKNTDETEKYFLMSHRDQ